MDTDSLVDRLSRPTSAPPDLAHRELLAALTRLYDGMGILGLGTLPPLHRVCPKASECWAGIAPADRPTGVGRFDAHSERGCMFLPWIGPNYRRGGVCVLGMNLRFRGEDWEFGIEHRIAVDQENDLRAGKRAHGSNWATSTMRDVAAIERSRRGEAPVEKYPPDEVAEALLVSARLQAVKCSPIGGRSSPLRAMNQNCPPRYLASEIDVLQPAVVLAYGVPAHRALDALGALTIVEHEPRFRRGTIAGVTRGFEVFLLTHSAHGGWGKSHRALVASVARRAPQ